MKNVDLIYDIFDQAAVIHYEHTGINYLDALSEINKNLNNNEYHKKLDEKIIEKLEFIYKPILEGNFLNEEVRLALELYIIKGLKHINYPPNIMTPDFINYLFVVIINELFLDEDINIIDTNLGTGNMLGAIKNNFPNNMNLIGIENDIKLTEFANAFMDIQANEIKIFFQDALNRIFEVADVVVGDLASYDVEDGLKFDNILYLNNIRYFPYLVISSRLDNIKDNGYFIYLVDNDFFSRKEMSVFKKYLDEHANLIGLITLPLEIFKDDHRGKSIIIGKKTDNKSSEIMAIEVSGLDKESLNRSISKIRTMINKIKNMEEL